MGSSKTANALMTKFNFEEKGYNVLLLKPSIDNRDGVTLVKSRAGMESPAVLINNMTDIMTNIINLIDFRPIQPQYIIIDEAQFLSCEQINQLKYIAVEYNIPVFCYGLRTDFQSNLFEGSKRLFELADEITEIKSICHCGNKAIINARYIDDKIVYEGEQIEIGGNEKYIGLCYRCWKTGKIK
jgi:thymidine kinase